MKLATLQFIPRVVRILQRWKYVPVGNALDDETDRLIYLLTS